MNYLDLFYSDLFMFNSFVSSSCVKTVINKSTHLRNLLICTYSFQTTLPRILISKQTTRAAHVFIMAARVKKMVGVSEDSSSSDDEELKRCQEAVWETQTNKTKGEFSVIFVRLGRIEQKCTTAKYKHDINVTVRNIYLGLFPC